jgi:hypothetical protein
VLLFHTYYILGAALMPAWLGLGSIALVSSRRLTYICLTILCVLSVVAGALILSSDLDMHKLSQIAGTPGTGILHPGAWLVMVIILNTLGVLAVVGVAIYSGWKLVRRAHGPPTAQASNLLRANILIMAGDLLNGAAGSLARFLGIQSAFWLVMAVGWTVFFVGVLLAGRRSQPRREAVQNKEVQVKMGKQVASS